MKNLAILIVTPLILLTLTGCTTRAQVVEDVWLDGKGNLVVQYATISHSDFLIHPAGKIKEGKSTTKTFYVGQCQENTDKSNKERK